MGHKNISYLSEQSKRSASQYQPQINDMCLFSCNFFKKKQQGQAKSLSPSIKYHMQTVHAAQYISSHPANQMQITYIDWSKIDQMISYLDRIIPNDQHMSKRFTIHLANMGIS
jgi:hypothetical protein